MRKISEDSALKTPGWTTDSKLVREFARPVDVTDAVSATVQDAIDTWPELSDAPPLFQFVDADKLDGLFKTKATDDSRWLPSAEFQFHGCRVTILYGQQLRVIVQQDP